MAHFFGVPSCDGHRVATRGGYLQNRAKSVGSEQNGSVAIPAASPSSSGIGQHLRPAARDIDAFQFAVRKESYRGAVR